MCLRAERDSITSVIYSTLYLHLSTASKNSLTVLELSVFLFELPTRGLPATSLSTSLPRSFPLLSTCHPSGPQSQSAHARYLIDASAGNPANPLSSELSIDDPVFERTPFVKPIFSNVSGEETSQVSCNPPFLNVGAIGKISFVWEVGFADGCWSCSPSHHIRQKISSHASTA